MATAPVEYIPDPLDVQSSTMARYLQDVRLVRESGTARVASTGLIRVGYIFPEGFIGADWKFITTRTPAQMELYEKIYRKVPAAGSTVDTIACFVLQAGFRITGSTEAVDRLNDWIRYMDVVLPDGFYGYLESVVRCIIMFGDAFVEVITPDMEQPPVSQGRARQPFPITYLKILHPKTMTVTRNTKGDVLGYTQDLTLIVPNASVPEVEFEPNQIIHYRFNPVADSEYGTSAFERIRAMLERKLGFEDDAALVVRQYASPLKHYKLGTEQVPATKDQIEEFRTSLLQIRPGDDLITSTAVTVEVVGARTAVMDVVPYQVQADRNLMIGLRTPEVLMGQGQDRTQATAEIEMQSFVYTAKAIQRMLKAKIEGEFFTRILGRSKEAMDRATISNLPQLEWNIIETERDRSQRIALLFKNDVLTLNEAREMAGVNTRPDGDIFLSEKTHKQAMELAKAQAKARLLTGPAVGTPGAPASKQPPTDRGTPAALQKKKEDATEE